MRKMSKKILFFGNERLATGVTTAAPTLQALINAGYEVAAVVVAQGEIGKSRKPRDLEVARIAEGQGIPVIGPAKLDEAKDDIKKYGAEAAVLVAYGKIVPQAVIDLFPGGIINIHPSLLPKHRGPTPIEGVILEGTTETGVSLMRLTSQMDAGPVYDQQKVELRGDETKQFIADQLLDLGKDMLLERLPAILDGSLGGREQDDEHATYDTKITKEDTELDFVRKDAVRLAREVRAFAGWPRSRAMIGTTEVIVTEAHAENFNGTPGTMWLQPKRLGMHCKEGTLMIEKLLLPGKKEMPAQAFLAGYKPV
jgi:methionyl-tRNA formyltransferase